MSPSSIAHYKIKSKLGEGGMGVVYRATDTKLNRDVAVKVLPPAVANDQERLARFEREARLLASLDHPNIGAIYGLEQSNGAWALVLALIEGPTLADRIAAGPIPPDETIAIARQMAEALEYAHERGIIHRDLKPANIKITPEGAVKILDFGLAKALTAEADAASIQPSLSPTMTVEATRAGVILGTAAYMAPEQAKGRPVDRRADIWAFGAILFEMLTGQPAFRGESVTEILASAMKDDAKLDRLPPSTPNHLRKLIRRCLEKDPRQRLQAIGEARIALEGPAEPETAATVGTVKTYRSLTVAALMVTLLALASLGWFHFGERAPAAEVVRFQVPAPENMTIGSMLAVSPDGKRLAFRAKGRKDKDYRIWVRSLDTLEAHPLAGTEGALSLFWSPDSRYLGFAVFGGLRKIEASGGPVQPLADVSTGAFLGGAWAPDGTIVFSTVGGGLLRVTAEGGTAAPVRARDARHRAYALNPAFLPDGRHFVYEYCVVAGTDYRGLQGDQCGIYVRSLDAKPEADDGALAKTMLNVMISDTAVAYAPSPDPGRGYVLFEQYGSLMALPFDARRLRADGAAVPIADGLAASSQLSDAVSLNPRSYSASATGLLAYLPNPAAATDGQLLWMNREGKVLGQVGQPGYYGEVALSADGKLVVVSRVTGRGFDHISVADSARGVFTRLNPGEATDYAGDAISPDGRIAFTYLPDGKNGDIYVKSANGAGSPELLVKTASLKHPNDWSRDGRYIIYDEHTSQKQDLWVVPTSGDRKPVPFLVTPADETLGRFSPDGRWVAYRSDESGQNEVYVQGFVPDRNPAAGIGKWQISTAGGDKPYWRHDGKEIYYIASDGTMMAVPVSSTATTFQPGVAVPLFQTHTRGYEPYAVAPDGRFLVNTLPEDPGQATPITVVLNWWTGAKK